MNTPLFGSCVGYGFILKTLIVLVKCTGNPIPNRPATRQPRPAIGAMCEPSLMPVDARTSMIVRHSYNLYIALYKGVPWLYTASVGIPAVKY